MDKPSARFTAAVVTVSGGATSTPARRLVAAASAIAENTMYGVTRNIGDAFSATTASLWKSLRIVR